MRYYRDHRYLFTGNFSLTYVCKNVLIKNSKTKKEIYMGAFEEFVGVNFFTMIFAWCNLLILYLFLKKILFKPLKNMIDSRQKEIDDMYSDAENAKDTANELKAEYESKMEKATEESEEILKKAVRKAQLKEEEILQEANQKAARTLERAAEQVEQEKKRAVNEIKNEVSEMAISIASAVIERDVSKDEHTALIDSFIEKIGD
ncbi:MAG: F0F1 ATP synthase subunit B [Ruminococcaceae bacterium]|nr:F0F1 ATP synthase subunit B [Oscillospiraceae bacterium]